ELLFRAFRDSRFANLAEPLVGYREDRIRLRRSVVARFKFAATVMKRRAGEGGLRQATGAFIEQAGKAVAETAATGLGLESLLVHRAEPAPPGSLDDWRDIWRATLSRARQFTFAEVPVDHQPEPEKGPR